MFQTNPQFHLHPGLAIHPLPPMNPIPTLSMHIVEHIPNLGTFKISIIGTRWGNIILCLTKFCLKFALNWRNVLITFDMNMWGAIKCRRTFFADDRKLVQSLAINHKPFPSTQMVSSPTFIMIHKPWTWHIGLRQFRCSGHFVLFSSLDEWALNAYAEESCHKKHNS